MKKSRFTAVDIAIILLASAMILTVVFRQKIVSVFDADKKVTVQYTFEADPVKLICAENMSSVKALYLASDLTEFGTVSEMAQSNGSNSDPNFVKISGTASVMAKRTDDGYYIDGKYLVACGCTYTVRDGYSQYEIVITSLTVID